MGTGIWLNYAFVLLVVGLMLLGLYALARGLGRARMLVGVQHKLVSVIDSTALGPQTTLFVVKAGERFLLVGGGAGHLATLAEIPGDEVSGWMEHQKALYEAQGAGLRRLFPGLKAPK